MKKTLLIMGAVLFAGVAMAQSPTREGNVIIDPYAGIPNWANSIVYSQFDPDNVEGTYNNVSNYGTKGGMLSYGGRVEYMVADNFGVGIDVNYEVSGLQFDYDSLGVPFHYEYSAKKLRAMVRMNYHFVQTDRADVYTGFAGGYKHVKREGFEENTITGDRTTVDGPGSLIPVAFRIAVGTRIYFTENIGAMVELGAGGGAILQFGLSAKF